MTIEKECPRCGAKETRGWSDLNEEDREIVKRLPASADYSAGERSARHRWCTRCWYEDTGHESREA